MTMRMLDRRRTRNRRCALWAGFVLSSTGVILLLVVSEAGWALLGPALALAIGGLGIGHRWMKDEGGVAVLTYHSISDQGDWLPWRSSVVSPESFERHLRMLKARFNVIRTADLLESRKTGAPLPPRPVAIHFDDGYLDNWVAALPLLERYGLPATLFVSLDFIEGGNALRPNLADVEAGRVEAGQVEWAGYLNWSELITMQRGGLIDIQPHGIDHGRVEVGPRILDRLTEENWRRLAWMQWRRMDGNKSGWHRWASPPIVPLGTPVRQSAPALAARAWSEQEGFEGEAAYERRVRSHLARSKEVLESRLDHPVTVFCWPENGTSPAARAIAARLGFSATTAGHGCNRPDEDPAVISRMGVGDRILGRRCPPAEAFALYAAIRLFQGNYYWFFPLIVIGALRRAHRLIGRGR